jgi:transcriptional regulator with XRE-family HTH domain
MDATTLRRARLNAGRSLNDVAAASGIAASNLSAIEHGRRLPTIGTVDLITSAIGVEFVLVPSRGRATVARASAAIGEAESSAPVAAYRTFLQLADDLASVNAFQRVLLAAEEPLRIRSRWDDAIAGLVEWRLAQARAPLPDWVAERDDVGEQLWEPQRTEKPLPLSADSRQVPEPLRRRGILIEEAEFASL